MMNGLIKETTKTWRKSWQEEMVLIDLSDWYGNKRHVEVATLNQDVSSLNSHRLTDK